MSTNVTAPLTGLVTRIDRLTDNTDIWTTGRLLDEGLDIVRDHCWATSSALYADHGNFVRLVRDRPSSATPEHGRIPTTWFPWGLGGTNPERFIFIENAERLPVSMDETARMGDLGIRSCAHLPLIERGRPVGYLQIRWSDTRLVWDDDAGRVLRTLARFLLRL